MYPLCLRPGVGHGFVSFTVQTSPAKSRASTLVLARHASRDLDARLGARVGFASGTRGVSALRDSALSRPGSRWKVPRRALLQSTRSEANAEAEEAEEEDKREVKCTLQVRRTVDYGSELLVMGNAYALGQWDKDYAPMMQWSEGDVWSCEVAIPEGTDVEFKFVVQTRRHDLQWEEFKPNRTFTVPSATCTYTADWNNETAEFELEEGTEEGTEEEEEITEEETPKVETPDKAALALSELFQLTIEVAKDESRTAKVADFEQKLADYLDTLRQTLDESSSNSLEGFVLALTQVSKVGMTWRDEHYKDISLKEQENFRQQLVAQEEKVAKLTEEVELCVPRDDELTKLNEAELMTALHKAELLTKITKAEKAELSEKLKALERSLATETERVSQLTRESKTVKESTAKEMKELQTTLAAEVEKVKRLTLEALKVKEMENALAAEVEKVENFGKARGVDKSKALERTLAEKRVLAEKLTKESIKVSRLEKSLARLEERTALAKSSDNVQLAERAAVAEEKLAEMTKELKEVKVALAEKKKQLEVSRESMAWRDNLYTSKLKKTEEAMDDMQRRERANWTAFKREHEALMGIMRQANVELERELAAVRAELANKDGKAN